MSDFVQQVRESIRERRLFCRRQSILVAVSGGLDSMVLLHVLHRLAPEHGWPLTVAHFNHQLRGRSSEADEKFVRQTAKRLKLPFIADRGDVKQLAAQQKLSVEMAARQLRHGFFARAARESGAQTIALAHHADDQVELFFLRLLRGAGSDGLAGMRWSRPSPTDTKLKLVRPLLGCAKEELQRFAICAKILFREDATNATMDFLRNRVRHELLPLLARRYQSALRKSTLRVMDLLEAEAVFVGAQAEAWLRKKRRPDFGELPLALQRRVLQLQLFQMGAEAGFDLIERLRTAPEAPVTLKPNLSVYRDKT